MPDNQIVGYADAHHEGKQKCRNALVDVSKKRGIVVQNCLTFAGMYAHCAKLFHDHWPSARIVSLERHKNIARYSTANSFCTVLNTSFLSYTKKLPAFVLHGEEFVRNKGFDFPKFDLVFLDFCANPRDYDIIRQFVENHTSPNAIIGVTFSIPPKQNPVDRLETVAKELQQLISLSVPVVVEEKIPYETGSNMIFIVFSKTEN
jgi:hypothetical protein